MLQVSFTGQFKKDYKLCKKRGYDMNLLFAVIDVLAVPKPLAEKHKDHNLSGNYANKR